MKSTMMTRMTLERHIGEEPEIDSIVTNITEALNYYSYFYNRQEAVGFFEDYMSKVDPNFLSSKNYEKIETTVGFIARMKSRNVSLPTETMKWFDAKVAEIPPKMKVVSNNLASLRDPLHSEIIAEIEERFDQNNTDDFNFLLDKSLPKNVVTKIIDFFEPRLKELEEIPNCPQLTEAYRGYSKKQIDDNINALKNLISTLSGNENKVVGRTKKTKSPEELTKYMEIMKKFDELNLKSIPVDRIVGATTAVFYIPAHRTIQIFRANVGESLSVKGKSIVNYDPENSFAKGIRKPEQVVGEFTSKNERKIKNAFDRLSTKERNQKTSLISNKHMLLSAF